MPSSNPYLGHRESIITAEFVRVQASMAAIESAIAAIRVHASGCAIDDTATELTHIADMLSDAWSDANRLHGQVEEAINEHESRREREHVRIEIGMRRHHLSAAE